MKENYDQYRKRQAIVEHPFGIMKRQWGFDYIMTKKYKDRASADIGLIFTAYNLRRIFNLLDKNLLKAWLKALFLFFIGYRSDSKLKSDSLILIQNSNKQISKLLIAA